MYFFCGLILIIVRGICVDSEMYFIHFCFSIPRVSKLFSIESGSKYFRFLRL